MCHDKMFKRYVKCFRERWCNVSRRQTFPFTSTKAPGNTQKAELDRKI